MTISARDKLVALYMVGSNFQALAEGKPLPYGPDFFGAKKAEPPTVDPEYTEGFEHARSGGKLKHNPYEGGSVKWWAWNDGYKAAKAQEAIEYRRTNQKVA